MRGVHLKVGVPGISASPWIVLDGVGTASPSVGGFVPDCISWLSQYLGFTYEYLLLDTTPYLSGQTSFAGFLTDAGKSGMYDISWLVLDNAYHYDAALLQTVPIGSIAYSVLIRKVFREDNSGWGFTLPFTTELWLAFGGSPRPPA